MRHYWAGHPCAVPVGQPPRGQLVQGDLAEHGENVAADLALDHLGALGAAVLHNAQQSEPDRCKQPEVAGRAAIRVNPNNKRV